MAKRKEKATREHWIPFEVNQNFIKFKVLKILENKNSMAITVEIELFKLISCNSFFNVELMTSSRDFLPRLFSFLFNET